MNFLYTYDYKIALPCVHSAVVGSIIVLTSLTELAGNPP